MKKLMFFVTIVAFASCGNPRNDSGTNTGTSSENSAVQPQDSLNRSVDTDTIHTNDGMQKPDSLRQ